MCLPHGQLLRVATPVARGLRAIAPCWFLSIEVDCKEKGPLMGGPFGFFWLYFYFTGLGKFNCMVREFC
jgi:hypothetical protein